MTCKTLLCTALAAATTLAAAPAAAQSAEPWRFEGWLNLYLPDLSGRVTFPGNGQSSEITIDAQKILENLHMAFAGSFEATRGRWGMFTDALYINVGAKRTNIKDISIGGHPLPADVSATVDYDMKGWGWTLGGLWRLSPDPDSRIDLLAGARLLDIGQTLNWSLSGNLDSVPTPGHAGSTRTDLANWDAIIGVKGRLGLGQGGKWYLPYYADIGTGDSDLTTQLAGGVGYTFQWGDVVGLWRHIRYEMKTGERLQDLSFSGPSISFVFRW